MSEQHARAIRLYLAGMAFGVAFIGFLLCARWIAEGTMSLYWSILPLFMLLAFGYAFIRECAGRFLRKPVFAWIAVALCAALLAIPLYRVASEMARPGAAKHLPRQDAACRHGEII